MGQTKREYAPSGAQNPSLSHVVPPSTPSTTAITPNPKSVLEIIPARQSPNDPAITSIAVGHAVNTTSAHVKSFSPDSSVLLPEPAIEYARAVHTPMSTKNSPPSAALEAVAAVPQPSWPASARVVRRVTANHMRLRTFRLDTTAAIRIRVRSPL